MVNISIKYTGQLHCDAEHGPSHAKLATDAPTDNKGKGEAFSPTDLVATALGTCISTTMGIKAEELGVSLKGMTVGMHRAGSSRCLQKSIFRYRRIRRTARSWSVPPSIARCTRVCRRKSIGRRNFSGKAESEPDWQLVRDEPTDHFSVGYNHST